jgi:hypothetical protein
VGGFNLAALTPATISLASRTGVKAWQITCIGTDETLSASLITTGLTVDYVNKTALFGGAGAGRALIFRSVVNGGIQDGVLNKNLITTFEVHVPIGPLRVMAVNEKFDSDPNFGWVTTINAMIRAH